VGVLATVAIRSSADGDVLSCAHCAQALSPRAEHYRLGCAELETPLPAISPLFGDPSTQIDGTLVWRQYLCPSCGGLLDGELCRPTDEPTLDLEVFGAGA
jgi:hypothetical protein